MYLAIFLSIFLSIYLYMSVRAQPVPHSIENDPTRTLPGRTRHSSSPLVVAGDAKCIVPIT